MNKRTQKTISVFTSITTTLWLSGLAVLAPMSALAVDVADGDLIRNPSAEGLAQFDIYIVKLVGEKKFKRLILSPHVFESYGHFDKNGDGNNWNDVMDVDQATMDAYTTSDLVRVDGTDKVYRLYAADGTDTGDKYWLNMTADAFTAVFDADSIYTINSTDSAGYTAGANVTDPNAAFPPTDVVSEGTLSVSLAADTPAAAYAVPNAARIPFTKINLTASGGDVIVDSLSVQRTGLVAQDAAFSGIDVVDGDTNLPINATSKTFNSLHKATFNDDFTVSNGTTKSITLSGNMASSLTAYAGEAPSLSLEGITLKGNATYNATLPITGNAMTLNSTITIGTATVQRGAYTNATSTSIQVGKEDYTFLSFQVQGGSAEKVEFSQIKVYQAGSATLGTDLVNFELLLDSVKIADGVITTSRYVTFNFDPMTIDKGAIKQFQIRADVEDGSVRTIILGIYRTTDLLVKGLTYGYNITPTYSGTGSSGNSPVLSDNQFTISNGTLQVTRSSEVTATNIAVGTDQYLGAFKFTGKGEEIDISALTLTIASGGGTAQIEDALTGVELVDPSGNVVAGPTDITNNALTVAWTDTFTVPVGNTVYKVRGDLATNGGWASDDTVTVSFTPSAMTATGLSTSNTITATPSSSVAGNTQTVKAATITITRNTLPASATIIVDQNNVVLSSWNFNASASGEDIRITSLLWAGRGQSATNTDALIVFIDENKNAKWDSGTDTALSPINDATTAQPATSTFAFDDPIIVSKGTAIHVAIKGDKDTVTSNATENWGLTDSAASVIAYGLATGNTVTETLTPDDGPTLTSAASGTLTIETSNNPSSAIVLAGSTGNVFTNVKLSAKNEAARLDKLIVSVADGSYGFNPAAGNYQDLVNVAIYDGTTKLAESSIESTGKHTFDFSVGDLTIPKGGSKTLSFKVDMSTVDPDADNSPGTNSADLKIGLGGTDGIKTTGDASNTEITGSNETYRDSTSSAMVLRSGKPTVTLPSASAPLGAATSLTNSSIAIFAFKVTADASGNDVLLFRNTFVFATSGSGMTLSNVLIKDQNGNTIKTAANPTSYDINGNTEYYYTATYNSPDFSNGDDQEAISVPAGESRTFKVFGTVAGAATGENISTFLVGDTVSSSSAVNSDNIAVSFGTPAGNFTTNVGNFIWSDNYKAASVSGASNATNTAQWYNGHLVPGLENAVSTTPYVLGWSG